jgi:outer membrane receptor protein involved in Fe transport
MNGSPIIAPSSLSFLENSSIFRLDDTVERMEVLRGGPSPIFSNGQPGATTNFILKEGTSQPHLSLRATYGTEGTYRIDAVAQGPITENTTYMIGGFYRYSDGFRPTGFNGDLGGQITGSVTHTFDAGKLNVYGRYLSDKNAFTRPCHCSRPATAASRPSPALTRAPTRWSAAKSATPRSRPAPASMAG